MLGAFSSRLRDKSKGTNADEYPGLRKAVDLIAQVLESPMAQRARDPLPRRLAETAFAASYFLKEFELVPALILQRVIERNRSELSTGLAECWLNVSIGRKPIITITPSKAETSSAAFAAPAVTS